jgi:hypothetical protein
LDDSAPSARDLFFLELFVAIFFTPNSFVLNCFFQLGGTLPSPPGPHVDTLYQQRRALKIIDAALPIGYPKRMAAA